MLSVTLNDDKLFLNKNDLPQIKIRKPPSRFTLASLQSDYPISGLARYVTHMEMSREYGREREMIPSKTLAILCVSEREKERKREKLPFSKRTFYSDLLTTWGRLLQKLAVVRPLLKLPAFYGTRKSSVVSKRRRDWSLS